MKSVIIVFFLYCIIISPIILQAQENNSFSLTEKAPYLNEILNQVVDHKKIFGTSFCIKYRDETWCGSSGDMTVDEPFFIASTTKLFTTAIILHLISEGKLSLDDKIFKYLNADIIKGLHVYKNIDYSNEITIKNLLAHTSGLPDYFEDKDHTGNSLEHQLFTGNDQFWSLDEVIKWNKNLSPIFPPGTKKRAHYSDTNFQLLGKIIENVTKKTYSENCKEILFIPLNLSKTYVFERIEDNGPKKMYYKGSPLNIPKAMTSFGSDGGIVSTSFELVTFLAAFFDGKFFPKSYINELQEWNDIFPPIKSGVGIHLFKLPAILGIPKLIGHSGLSGAMAYYDPVNEIFIAGTVNQIAYPSTSFMVATKLIQTILSKKKDKTVSALAVGTTYSKISNIEGKSRIGLSIGLYKEYKLSKPISFTTEILYNQKGGKNLNKLEDIKLHYIDLPLMLKLNSKNKILNLSSGISTNILIGANQNISTFNRLEYSIPFTITYSATDFLQLCFRYNKGLNDIIKSNNSIKSLKNNWFGLTLQFVKL